MGWCFAIVNNKLAEIYFEKKKNGKVSFYGHCYVKKSDYTTIKEKQWIEEDTKAFRFAHHSGKYTRLPGN